MKNTLIYVILGVMVLSIYSCSSTTGNKKIGLLVHTTNSSRWQMDIDYIHEKAAELGLEVILKDANNNEKKQLEQANEALNEGADVLIVIAANHNTAAGIVRNAHKKNVPVISYDRLIRNSNVDYLVSFEYQKVGNLLVEYVAGKAPKGNTIVLYGDANDGNAKYVKEGIETSLNSLGKDSQLNIVYESYVDDWSYDNAKHVMNQVLDFHPDNIDAIIACNDPLGIGAYDALRQHGYEPNEVTITGQDATTEFVNSLVEGGLSMSVYKPIKELAYGSVEIAFNLINKNQILGVNGAVNNGRKDVPAILFEPSVVDKSNYEKILHDAADQKTLAQK